MQFITCDSPLALLLLIFSLGIATPLQALEELEILNPAGAMAGPDRRAIGWEWHYIDQNGKAGFMRKITGDDSIASYIRSDGCEWTRTTRGFAPASVWSNCPSSGQAEVEFNGGDIWPLKVGRRFSYKMRGTSSFLSFNWNGKRNCEVPYRVRVKTVAGEYDSFKVVCIERWGTRSWWLSPEVGTAVAYRQTRSRNEDLVQEMTRIVRP